MVVSIIHAGPRSSGLSPASFAPPLSDSLTYEVFVSGRVETPERLRSTIPRQGRPLLSYSLVNLHNARQEGEGMIRHGISNGVWNQAKEETRQLLIEKARAQKVIGYFELAAKIRTVSFHARDQVFFDMLTEISKEEDAARI